MSERWWRLLISGSGGLLLFLAVAYGLRAFQAGRRDPVGLRRNLTVLAVLGLLLLFLALLARIHQP